MTTIHNNEKDDSILSAEKFEEIIEEELENQRLEDEANEEMDLSEEEYKSNVLNDI